MYRYTLLSFDVWLLPIVLLSFIFFRQRVDQTVRWTPSRVTPFSKIHLSELAALNRSFTNVQPMLPLLTCILGVVPLCVCVAHSSTSFATSQCCCLRLPQAELWTDHNTGWIAWESHASYSGLHLSNTSGLSFTAGWYTNALQAIFNALLSFHTSKFKRKMLELTSDPFWSSWFSFAVYTETKKKIRNG